MEGLKALSVSLIAIALSACATATKPETFRPNPQTVNPNNQQAIIDLLVALDFPQAHHLSNVKPKDVEARIALFRETTAESLDVMGFRPERADSLRTDNIDLFEILERLFIQHDFNFEDRVFLYGSTLRARMGEGIETGFRSFAGPYAFQLEEVELLNGSVPVGKLALRNSSSSHGKILKRGDDCVFFWNGRADTYQSVSILPQAGSIFCQDENGKFVTHSQIGGREEISDTSLKAFLTRK